MCRNVRYQDQAIRYAKSFADEVFAVFERGEGASDLTTIIAICGDSAEAFHVYRYGEMESETRIDRYIPQGFKALARMFDVDRRTCDLVPC